MQINTSFPARFLAVALLATLALASFAKGQNPNQDRILVTGEYPLTQSSVDRLTEIYEWILSVRFSPAERKKYQLLAVKEAQANKISAKAVTDMLQSWEKIQKLDASRREKLRLEMLPDIISAMEKEITELNELLLAVYRNSRGKAEDDDAVAGAPDRGEPAISGGTVRVADLTGIWSTSSVSGERYRSLVTGELSDPSGSIIEYQISPNGTIKHVGYLSSTVYSCTTKLFITRTGRISISGSNITFDFAPGKRMYQTCSASASRNDTLPAERKTYPFRIERDQYGVKLCTLEDGKDFCIRRRG